jgi:hypothetical protein
MGKEFCVLYKWKGGEPTDTPIAVVLAEDEVVTFTTTSEDFDSWGDYFRRSRSWRERHAKTDLPLSSLFGKNAYMSGDYMPYNAKTKAQYDEAVSAMKGDTVIFRPDKSKRKR